jgi:hypothetical protein
VRLKAEVFQPAVSQVLDVLVDVVGVQAQDALWQQVVVILLLHVDGVKEHLLDFVREFLGLQVFVFFQHC